MTGESRHRFLVAGGIKSIAQASITGELVNFGEHPGLRLSPYAKTRVTGELIELEALDRIIEELDREEGPEYRREIVNVSREDGTSQFAWTYVVASDSSALPVIETGDWRRR